MIQWQNVQIPLANGVDEKADKRALNPPKLAICQNAVFDEIGGMQRRFAFDSMGVEFTAGGSAVTSRMRGVGARNEEALLFAYGKVYTWSAKESAWMDRGRHEPVLVDQRTVLHDRTDQVLADRAETGNVIGYIWQDLTNAGVRWAAFDKVTRASMDSSAIPFTSSSTPTRPRGLAVDGKLWFVLRIGTDIQAAIVDPANVYGTLAPLNKVIATDCAAAGASAYDICVLGTSVVVAYVTAGGLVKVKLCDSSGTVTAINVTGRAADFVGVSYTTVGNKIGLIRKVTIPATSDEVRWDWLKADGSDDTVNILVSTESLGFVRNVTSQVRSSNSAVALWDLVSTSGTAANLLLDQVRLSAMTGSAVSGTVKVLARGSYLASKAALWTDGAVTRVIVTVGHGTTGISQPCQVLLDATYVVGETNGLINDGDELGLLARVQPGEGAGKQGITADRLHVAGHLPQLEQVSTNVFASALPFARRLSAGRTSAQFAERGIRDITYTFADSKAFRGVMEGQTLYLPGGFLAQYDGKKTTEASFLLWTEGITGIGTTAGSGALKPNTNYYARFYWEKRTASGERLLSSHVGSIAVTTGAAHNAVTYSVPYLPYTMDPNVILAGYLSTDGIVFYRCTSLDPTASTFKRNSTNADSVSVVIDAYTDTNELDYLSSDQLDNVAPPPCRFVAAGQNRVFTDDPEDRNKIWHSKLRLEGDGVSFNETQVIQVPQYGGTVTDVEVSESAIIVLKERAIYHTGGQGPDNFGNGLYPYPQRIADVGCDEVRSVVSMPMGYMFHSKKGIYLLSPTLGVAYVGAEVEDSANTTIYGAVHIPSKHQVRFLTSTQQLVYDYHVGEWSVWTSSGGTSMALWVDTPIHLDPAVAPKQPSSNRASVNLIAETPWMKILSLGDFYSAKSLLLTGQYRGEHQIRVRVAYDYAENDAGVTWTDDKTFDYAAGGNAGDLAQEKMHFSRRKVQAIKMRFEDQTLIGTIDAGMSLTGVTLEVGRERGLARKPASLSK